VRGGGGGGIFPSIEDINEEASRTVLIAPKRVDDDDEDFEQDGGDTAATSASKKAKARGNEDQPADAVEDTPLDIAAQKLMRQLVQLVVEPGTHTGMVELMRASPLAKVTMTPDSGNVLLFADLNSYGDAMSRPDVRKCPIPQKALDKFLKAAQDARMGDSEAAKLHAGDIFAMIDGGVDRQRLFTAPLQPALAKRGTAAQDLCRKP